MLSPEMLICCGNGGRRVARVTTRENLCRNVAVSQQEVCWQAITTRHLNRLFHRSRRCDGDQEARDGA